ncbi:aminoacrylate hydrolase [Neorhizobium huautlense]|uniref:Putative carbamate hydrolase RutD n=1 Tax=Neorhizobium huautlense TaxID=67774 RepID=A0ABT9PM45_9HYPH|nr:pyrimidine utilization protein D [Neorhizobium huautlense]MDP9835516.1 aminoacrylate hydrolase [Neorhizobium huautlense]
MLHFDVRGSDAADASTIILSSGLGGSAAYWAPQMEALKARFRVVTYDHFGTGRSPGEVPEGYSISDMADEVMEIASGLGLTSFSFMGHAFGGLVGLDLALRFPERIEKIVLINAWAKADPHSGRCFDVRIALLENSGVPAFVKAQPLFLYPAIWMAENSARMEEEEKHALSHFQGRENILRRIAALRAFDIEDRLGDVTAPTLVVATKDDMLVPYSRSLQLGRALPDATLALFEFGAHAVNVVDPQAFNAAMLSFLNDR